jgi:hypothetical protein
MSERGSVTRESVGEPPLSKGEHLMDMRIPPNCSRHRSRSDICRQDSSGLDKVSPNHPRRGSFRAVGDPPTFC